MQGPKYVGAEVCKGLIIQSIQGPKLLNLQTESHVYVYEQPLNDPKENVSFKRAGALLLVGAVSWSRWIFKQRWNIKAAKSVSQEKSMPGGQVD